MSTKGNINDNNQQQQVDNNQQQQADNNQHVYNNNNNQLYPSVILFEFSTHNDFEIFSIKITPPKYPGLTWIWWRLKQRITQPQLINTVKNVLP